MKVPRIPDAKPHGIKGHLCFACNNMLVRPHDKAEEFEKFEKRSGTEVTNSIKAGCRLCTMLDEILKIRHLPLLHTTSRITPRLVALNEMTPDVWVGTRGSTRGKYCRIDYFLHDEVRQKGLGKIDIALVPKDDEPIMRPFFPFRKHAEFPLSSSTNSNPSFEFIKKWSTLCRNSHDICNSDRGPEIWVPTRLVDVSDADSQRPRVIVTASEHIGDCEYLCLTHRWIDMRLKLESTNIDELRKEIPIEELSQTFRDAFATTRQLGFRYIWIDSLCIMQDHQREDGWQDWLTESARMGENYKHAALTIAPTPMVDNADEFFSNRDMPQRTPLAVNIEREAPEDMTWSRCIPTQVDVSGHYYCFSEDLWLSQVDRAPLNRRGWVYQERLLSPRTVHFATEVIWECRQDTASEMLPMGFPRSLEKPLFAKNTKCWRGEAHGPNKFLNQYGTWMTFVENFSHCHLTMERDKLPAVAGVAAVVELPNDQYLAGLWRGGLASQLIWQRSEKRLGNYEPPTNYRAPSWSWASVNGPIEFAICAFHINKRSRYTAVIKDCRVDLLAANDPFGQVTGAQLCLRGDLAHISPERIAANPGWMLRLDCNTSSMRVVTYYLCIFVADVAQRDILYLLVLEPTGAKGEIFRRVGLLSIHLESNTPMEGFKVFPDCTITIV